LLKRPQYAIWDDHEYGWNNADRSFPLKDTSLAVFKHFWRNPSYGTPDLKGIFFNVRHADAEFFMTDGRYHCDKSPLPDGKGSTAMFGKEQMDWLKTALKNSTARFKFIVCGSQIISNDPTAENMGDYPVEKKDLLDFLQHENIKGVIFLSGDRHFAELSKMEREGTYPLYDITASSFTSPSYPHKLRNDYRVAGTMTKKHNFCRITLDGIGNDRVCYVELFDTKGNLIWKKEIKATDLQ
jgi:alkaline phosphatase D